MQICIQQHVFIYRQPYLQMFNLILREQNLLSGFQVIESVYQEVNPVEIYSWRNRNSKANLFRASLLL